MIGSHPDCVSPFGAYDMVGNVDEWTDDRESGSAQVADAERRLLGTSTQHVSADDQDARPEFQFYQIGFRCCADAQDGIDASVDERLPPWRLEQRAGPDGWPVPNAEERALRTPPAADVARGSSSRQLAA